MKKIKLSNREYNYLISSDFLPFDCQSLLRSIHKMNSDYQLELQEDKVDTFRDLFGDRLQTFGFDKNYELTKEGELLEDLIDKFYFG